MGIFIIGDVIVGIGMMLVALILFDGIYDIIYDRVKHHAEKKKANA